MSTGFQVGPLFIRYYGIILMVGVLAAAFLIERIAHWRKVKSAVVWDGLIWVLIGGILGARLWHIFTPMISDVEGGVTTLHYLTHPLDAIAIWKGGLGIPGAVIGGVVAGYLFCRKNKYNFLMWADFVAPGLALGQAIGRWGNFINQELYGLPTNLPWAIHIDPQYRLLEYKDIEYYHPLFLYESLLSFLNVIILVALVGVLPKKINSTSKFGKVVNRFLSWLSSKITSRLYYGDVFLVYLILYPIERFFLEFLRLTPSEVLGINVNQALMMLVALAALATLIWRHIRPRQNAIIEGKED